MEIDFFTLTASEADKLASIDRSETVDSLLEMKNGAPVEQSVNMEVPGWTPEELHAIRQRFVHELQNGGYAVGAYEADTLVGFGVLCGRLFGPQNDYMQVDLMYVSRSHRGHGIGSSILDHLAHEALKSGAQYLYISSTETLPTVSFYQKNGADYITDPELLKKEPKDIHMLMKISV